MVNLRAMKVPVIKYQQAKQYQMQLQNKSGLNLPLWACMLENEKRERNNHNDNNINKFYRRLI